MFISENNYNSPNYIKRKKSSVIGILFMKTVFLNNCHVYLFLWLSNSSNFLNNFSTLILWTVNSDSSVLQKLISKRSFHIKGLHFLDLVIFDGLLNWKSEAALPLLKFNTHSASKAWPLWNAHMSLIHSSIYYFCLPSKPQNEMSGEAHHY